MSTSRHINLTRIVPIFLMGLVVLFCLPLGVRSEQFSLTANAYETSYSSQKGQSISSYDWTASSSQVIDYYWTVYGVNAQSWRVTGFNCSGRYHGSYGNDDVYYTVIIRDSNNTFLYQSADTNIGTPLEFTLSSTNKQGADVAYNIQVRLFRLNGASIYRDSLPASSVTLFFTATDNIEENTMPSEWLENTTASYVFIPLDTYTTAITVPDADYTLVEEALLVPSPIERAYQYISGLMVRILNFRKLLFIIIFNIIIGLAIWLLH